MYRITRVHQYTQAYGEPGTHGVKQYTQVHREPGVHGVNQYTQVHGEPGAHRVPRSVCNYLSLYNFKICNAFCIAIKL